MKVFGSIERNSTQSQGRNFSIIEILTSYYSKFPKINMSERLKFTFNHQYRFISLWHHILAFQQGHFQLESSRWYWNEWPTKSFSSKFADKKAHGVILTGNSTIKRRRKIWVKRRPFWNFDGNFRLFPYSRPDFVTVFSDEECLSRNFEILIFSNYSIYRFWNN